MIWKKVAAHAECARRVTTTASATGSGGGRPLYGDDFPRLLFRNQETFPPPLPPPPKRLSRPGEDGLYDDNNNGYVYIV